VLNRPQVCLCAPEAHPFSHWPCGRRKMRAGCGGKKQLPDPWVSQGHAAMHEAAAALGVAFRGCKRLQTSR
jgi:hypothetical protein